MTGSEMVTEFSTRASTYTQICKAVTRFCKSQGHEPEEYGFNTCPSYGPETERKLPEKFWHLIAFAVEGNSEGYYVHIGYLVRGEGINPQTHEFNPATYHDIGFAKTYSPASAQALATEAQRFLTASEWN